MNDAADNRIPVPGDIISDELDERGWTQEDLARMMNRPLLAIHEIIKGKRAITPETAVQLEAALKIDAQFWLNLETEAALLRARASTQTGVIQAGAKAFELAPVREIEKRGWIKATKNPDGLNAELCKLLMISSLDEQPPLRMAAKQSVHADKLTAAQVAWGCRALHLARGISAASYSPAKLRAAMKELRVCARQPEGVRNVPKVLSEAGVRLVIIEHLKSTKIDGAALWKDASPVIALSLRFGRIDNFWFTLQHEIDHILTDGPTMPMLDIDLSKGATEEWSAMPNIEARANANAANALIDQSEMDSFVRRVGPWYSKTRIVQFANRIKVHPGIIVGQLFHRGEIGPFANREMLDDIRKHIIGVAMTDGFGHSPDVG